MKNLVYIVLFFIASVHAQMLDNTHMAAFEGKPAFNQSFIRQQGIYTIRGNFSTKVDLDIIRESSDACYFKFNRFGELTFEYHTLYKDTIYTLYAYDERGNVTIKRIADKYGFQSYHYRYDHRNRLLAVEVRNTSNTGQDLENYVPDESARISLETYSYQELDGQNYKKFYLNSAGIVYMEEFFYFDESGRIIKQETYQKSGSGNRILTYTYDDQGRILSKKSSSNLMGNYSNTYIYEYDEFNNIFSMKYYEDDQYKTEYQYVYDSSTQQLKAFIMRDVASNKFTIVKYDHYSFYNL